ncbi:MAG: RsmB/NOP family class I SAM-dependent RNA methyltransferase [Alphaproteobacteria bacterium]|nr:RsmB/NOP family class I SAM-dependent RNA methyltransferase [Alphaproteobacteria bacterium]
MEKRLNQRLRTAYVLQNILEEKIFFGELKKQIPPEELPFINMNVLTTLRHLTALKSFLSSLVRKKIPHKHRLAEYLLLAAISEILYLNTPDYAVINETVNDIKKHCDKFLAGMANAVLRKIAAEKENFKAKSRQISPFPKNFLPLLEGYEKAQISAIAESVNQISPLDISVKDDPTKWKKTLNSDLLPNGTLRLYEYPAVNSLPGYQQGAWWVQDVAASLPVAALGDLQGKKVIDLCAAPGGKTAQLAAKGAQVTALDISESRLQTLKENMQRLGFSQVISKLADAAQYLQNTAEQYDVVLLDAPCSASGTFRRHPEVLHIKTLQDAETQVALQQNLLNLCENALKPGGILLYCVCSICKKEGEEQIEKFLSTHSNFKLSPINEADISPYGKWEQPLISPKGWIRTLPFMQKGMDSFFICKMQRII